MENLENIVGIIVSGISIMTAIYKICFRKDTKREKAYYEKVLSVFVRTYKKNQDINAIKFMENILEDNDDIIPKYVIELVKDKNNDSLKKVLICDYCELYCNEENKIKKLFGVIEKTIIYLQVGTALFLLFGGSILITVGVVDITTQKWIEGLKNCAAGILTIGVSVFAVWLAGILNRDNYTIKKKRAKKIIDKKVKTYDKRYDDVIL